MSKSGEVQVACRGKWRPAAAARKFLEITELALRWMRVAAGYRTGHSIEFSRPRMQQSRTTIAHLTSVTN